MQNRYNYIFDNITSTYNFTTKNNILYRVAFIVDSTFTTISQEEIPNVYQLIVEKANDEIEPLDAKVSWTIGDIVERFLDNIKNSLVYVCADIDSRASIRLDTFDRWYQRSDAREKILKIDKIIQIEIHKEMHRLYTSLMFHKDNPHRKKLISIYNNIEKFLNEEK
ncbi:MAG: DUF6169 family protein [Bacteroidia bacterium]